MQPGLLAAIQAISDPTVPVALATATPVTFKVGLSLKIDPDWITATVQAAVQAALSANFSTAARTIGQDVAAVEIVACAQAVPGIIACVLTQLQRPGQVAAIADPVVAYVPPAGAFDPGSAEILLLDPQPIAFGTLS